MTGTATLDGDTVVITPAPAPASANSANQPPTDSYFTAEQVADIRRQEKDKLYPQLERQKEQIAAVEAQLAAFNADRAEAQRLAAEQAQVAADAQRAREDAELSAKDLVLRQRDEFQAQIDAVRRESEDRLRAVQEERDQAAALLAREQQYQALEAFKTRRIAEVGDDLAPVFVDLVTGNTEDEVERSISTLVAKSSTMIEAYQQSTPAPRLRGVPATGAAPTGPLENSLEQQTLTAQDIKGQSNEWYRENRAALLAAVSRSRQQQ